MLKTIKVKKKLNLSELIEYISESRKKDTEFVSNYENLVNVDYIGQITTVGKFYNDFFIVEVEEEITRSTIFDCLVRVEKDRVVERRHCSISGIKNENTIRIYALLDEELQLIWEAK